jgi:hypothetical protein
MTYMRSWKSHRLTSHTWLGLNPQIGRPFSRIVGAIGFFLQVTFQQSPNYLEEKYWMMLRVTGAIKTNVY